MGVVEIASATANRARCPIAVTFRVESLEPRFGAATRSARPPERYRRRPDRHKEYRLMPTTRRRRSRTLIPGLTEYQTAWLLDRDLPEEDNAASWWRICGRHHKGLPTCER